MGNLATYRTETDRTDQPSELTAKEIAALALSLAHLGTGPQAASARRALRTLFASDEHCDVEEYDVVRGATLDTLTKPLDPSTADRARVVATAITEFRVVRLCYGDAAANVTIREVEPVTCLVHRENWYLVGWCRLRRGIRAFRFDRILAVESTGLIARPHRPEQYLPFQPRTLATA